MIEFEEVGTLPTGQVKLKFTNTSFDDIIFTLGKVSFTDTGDGATLHYEYDVVEHTNKYQKNDLDKLMGDFIMQLLDRGVEENNLVYTGGTDDNRETNIIESDSE